MTTRNIQVVHVLRASSMCEKIFNSLLDVFLSNSYFNFLHKSEVLREEFLNTEKNYHFKWNVFNLYFIVKNTILWILYFLLEFDSLIVLFGWVDVVGMTSAFTIKFCFSKYFFFQTPINEKFENNQKETSPCDIFIIDVNRP